MDTLNGTSLDLVSGYWQIELDDDTCLKSAFTTHNVLYEFTQMPFGLCNAPATLQRSCRLYWLDLKERMCLCTWMIS